TGQVATLIVNVPATIITPPANQTAIISSNANLSAVATGTPPLAYQWFFNTNTFLSNATNSSLLITNAQLTNAGTYFVIVTNSFGMATSSVAALTVVAGFPPSAYFVSASNGNDSNPGSLGSPFKTISKGLSKIPNGGYVYLRGDTYALSSKLSLS